MIHFHLLSLSVSVCLNLCSLFFLSLPILGAVRECLLLNDKLYYIHRFLIFDFLFSHIIPFLFPVKNSLFLSFFVYLFQIVNWPLFRCLLKSLSSFIFLVFFPFFLYLTYAYVCLFFLFFCFPSFDQPWFILGDMCAFHSLQLACLCKKQKKRKSQKLKKMSPKVSSL